MAERKSFLLRISPELWSELEAWAGSELRSVNGQIEYLLREAVVRRRRAAAAGDGTSSTTGSSPLPNVPPASPPAGTTRG